MRKVAEEIARRLASIFVRDGEGRRSVHSAPAVTPISPRVIEIMNEPLRMHWLGAPKRRARVILAVAFGALHGAGTTVACADEGGTAFWSSGQYASLAAIPPAPGWSANLSAYEYFGKAGGSKPLPLGHVLTLGAKQRSATLSVQPGYASDTSLFGGQPFIGISFGLGGNRTEANVSILDAQVSRSDTLYAGSDLYPIASIAWTRSNDNWMAYLTGDIPTGAYQASRLANMPWRIRSW